MSSFCVIGTIEIPKENSMEHTKAYQEFKKNGNTKFVRYSEGAEIQKVSMKDEQAVERLSLRKLTK